MHMCAQSFKEVLPVRKGCRSWTRVRHVLHFSYSQFVFHSMIRFFSRVFNFRSEADPSEHVSGHYRETGKRENAHVAVHCGHPRNPQPCHIITPNSYLHIDSQSFSLVFEKIIPYKQSVKNINAKFSRSHNSIRVWNHHHVLRTVYVIYHRYKCERVLFKHYARSISNFKSCHFNDASVCRLCLIWGLFCTSPVISQGR